MSSSNDSILFSKMHDVLGNKFGSTDKDAWSRVIQYTGTCDDNS